MASIRVRPETGLLFIDYRVDGKRCREQTDLKDTATNRKKLNKRLRQIETAIKQGRFETLLEEPAKVDAEVQSPLVVEMTAVSSTPLFKHYVQEWLSVTKVAWRRSHTMNIEGMVDRYFLPAFGEKEVGAIKRADLLKFRSSLAKVPGRNGNTSLSANRINKIMDPLRRIFEEAADAYDFSTPFHRIKPLKIRKSDVMPFTLDEVQLILSKVRVDYRNYYTVRFFTGMRTGEVDGLQWKYIDFERRLILVRETIVNGQVDYTKTNDSQRDISMTQPVYDALKAQHAATGHLSKFVFCNLKGDPLEHNNVTKRVWYPLLARLGLEKRRPYQTRHTAATLWLAAGEAPEWIARQMGHATTEMLFKVYSRYVPNLTRQDGSAFEKLLTTMQPEEGLTETNQKITRGR